MTTAQDIINGAMKKLGVLRKGESPSSDESSDALTVLNDLLASWSNDSLFITSQVLESFTLTGGVSSYTIGSGGDFNTSRPLFIDAAYVRIGNIDYTLQIIDDEQYAKTISIKNLSGVIPTVLTYNNAYPLGTIKIYTVPSTNTTLYLLSEKQITSLSGLTSTFDMAPGWSLALKSNLAILLADEYNVDISPQLEKSARDSVALIKRSVLKNKPVVFNAGETTRYSIYSDQ